MMSVRCPSRTGICCRRQHQSVTRSEISALLSCNVHVLCVCPSPVTVCKSAQFTVVSVEAASALVVAGQAGPPRSSGRRRCSRAGTRWAPMCLARLGGLSSWPHAASPRGANCARPISCVHLLRTWQDDLRHRRLAPMARPVSAERRDSRVWHRYHIAYRDRRARVDVVWERV